jgi:Domain of unknown function (DUF4157)
MRTSVGGASLVSQLGSDAPGGAAPAVGKRTRVDEAGTAPPGAAVEPGKQTRVEAEGAGPDARSGAAEQAVQTLAPRFGVPLDHVRMHADAAGDARAAAHGAPAVAEGANIYLSQSVDPSSATGQRIVAHELSHVIQQTSATSAGHGGRADASAYEREAHRVGDIVAAGGSAQPVLRTDGPVAQGYGAPEHQTMGDDVHSVLQPVADASGGARLGGMSAKERAEQVDNEKHSNGASHAPGLGRVETLPADGSAAVPELADMLARDPLQDRSRSLTISLRNFKMMKDAAGPYLGIEVDDKTHEAARYDVPVSPGDMTTLNGDLYGSMENMRKAPVTELIELQKLVDQEAAWERNIAAGKADPKNEPNFDAAYEKATAWRAHPVYVAGKEIATEGQAGGGDKDTYIGLARHNEAHYGQDTKSRTQLEVQVQTGDIAALAKGPQGNAADGNERAWIDGHARALLLAREAFALGGGGDAKEQARATADRYGHETAAPETGLEDPAAGGRGLAALPRSATNAPLKRSSGQVTAKTKLNDAYVENAGADHFLTDAFSAGHQIARGVIGDVTEQFVKDKGGRSAFLSFIVKKIQEGAIADKEHAQGELGDFQDASRTWKDKAARGESWLNTFKDGLKQTLQKKVDDNTLRAIGTKLVHDYYNRHGLVVHNRKGMTFVTKGDGHADEAPEARQIIAMAVLTSRDQITQTAATGAMPDPMAVWAYVPDLKTTQFTSLSGKAIMEKMFSDSTYLWRLIKNNFSIADAPSTTNEQQSSKYAPAQKQINRLPVDKGTTPLGDWFARRHQYVRKLVGKDPPKGHFRKTADGVTIPVHGA